MPTGWVRLTIFVTIRSCRSPQCAANCTHSLCLSPNHFRAKPLFAAMRSRVVLHKMFDEDKSGKIDEDEFFFLLQFLGIEVGDEASLLIFFGSHLVDEAEVKPVGSKTTLQRAVPLFLFCSRPRSSRMIPPHRIAVAHRSTRYHLHASIIER